jgi:enoyl-CoA hydratase/carnithine racemase
VGLVELQRRGAAAVLTMRAGHGNRLSTALARDLLAALREAAVWPGVRALVLAGGDSFCVGADLKERATLPKEGWPEHHVVFEELALALQDFYQPTIAAVRGWALGGGSELALGCDIVVAAPDARFGQPEALRGLVPGMGGPQLLARRLPHGMAAYLLYTGQVIDAESALRIGLVTFLDKDPVTRALGIAAEIAQASPVAVQALRRLLQRSPQAFSAALEQEVAAWREAVAAGDAVEGAQAFAEKRPPAWTAGGGPG